MRAVLLEFKAIVAFDQHQILSRRSPFGQVGRVIPPDPNMHKGFRWAGFPGWRFVGFAQSHDLALPVERDGRLRLPISDLPVNFSPRYIPDRLIWAF